MQRVRIGVSQCICMHINVGCVLAVLLTQTGHEKGTLDCCLPTAVATRPAATCFTASLKTPNESRGQRNILVRHSQSKSVSQISCDGPAFWSVTGYCMFFSCCCYFCNRKRLAQPKLQQTCFLIHLTSYLCREHGRYICPHDFCKIRARVTTKWKITVLL